MNTRMFQAASVQEAIRQARRELGVDAMLLNSKRVPATRAGEGDQFAVKFAFTHAVPASTAKASASTENGFAGGYSLARRVHEAPRGTRAEPARFESVASAARSGPTAQPGDMNHAGTPGAATRLEPAAAETRGPSGSAGTAGEPLPGEPRGAIADRNIAPVEAVSGAGSAQERTEPAVAASAPHDAAATESLEKLREQMLSMRKEMLQLAGSVRRVNATGYRQKLASDSLRYLHDLLVEQEFHADLIERILSSISATPAAEPAEASGRGRNAAAGKTHPNRSPRKRSAPPAEAVPDPQDARLFGALQDAIAAHVDLMAEPALRRKRSNPLVISLVGPPGAGKTTTLVKLAVRYNELSRFPLQLISMDNFRVGASEQLRAYAAVLGVGFDTLTTVSALEKALQEYSSKEIILIDTPGLGWRDFDAADELAAFLGGLNHKITHMVAPASMRPADFERLADLYEAFDYDSLIYTKLDETASIGQLISESWRRKKPLAYFATGQRIPDDLEVASRERICERILPSDSLSAHFAA